ncbi:MAG: PilN domain-containing protein [Deltaproteobacteria bacterium]|nr:PilN domain-containing protein [Deltaproteobacteria bacterium]
MARYTLGICWDEVSVDSCLLKTGMTEFTLEKLSHAERNGSQSDGQARDIYLEIRDLMAGTDVVPDICISSLSENEIMYRALLRPFSDRKKVADTIGSEVETLLPVMDSRIIVDFVLLGRDDAGLYRVETVSARQSSVSGHIDQLKAAGLNPEIIDSPSAALVGGARNIFDLEGNKSYLFLHMGWRETSLAVLEGKELRYIGAFPYGFEKLCSPAGRDETDALTDMKSLSEEMVCSQEDLDAFIREVLISLHYIGSRLGETVLVPLGYAHYIKDLSERFEETGGIPTEIPRLKEILFEGPLDDILVHFLPISLACRAFDSSDTVNFRQGDLSYTKRMEWLRSYAGVWAKAGIIIVALWFISMGLDAYLKAQVSQVLTEKIRQEFTEVMPKGTPMVDPVKQMEQHFGRLSGQSGGLTSASNDSSLEILKDISVNISKDIDVVLDNFTLDETTITISGSTKSYDNVEKIKTALSTLPFVTEVKIVTANVDKANQRVNVKLVCKR